MVFEDITIEGSAGMPLRPAMLFASRMGRYDASIRLESGKRCADGKSLVSIISAGFSGGTRIKVTCDGPDEEEMLRRATELIRGL